MLTAVRTRFQRARLVGVIRVHTSAHIKGNSEAWRLTVIWRTNTINNQFCCSLVLFSLFYVA